jgi:CelD/BcsL family acetyltransferase involved in cellulose biosynthesis
LFGRIDLKAVKIDVIRPRDLTDGQIARWMGMQARAPALQNPFFAPQWAQAVERAQARGDGDPGVRVAVLGDDEGFFAARRGAFTALPAGAPMADYQGVVGAADLDFDPKALVKALGVSRLDFNHMLHDQAPFSPYLRGEALSWIVDVSAGYAAYEAETRARSSVLKDIDKKRRKAEREAGAAQFTAFSRSSADFSKLLAWKRAQYRATGQTDIFNTAWCLALVEDLFERRDPHFGGALFTLHLGGELAAAHFHLYGGPVIHGWLIAHNAAFERYSPGMLLFQDILKWMDGGPYGRLDLGCGDYRFKRELSNQQVRTGYGFVGTPSPATLVRSVAYGLRGAAESLPLGAASALPGKAMRRLDLLRALR